MKHLLAITIALLPSAVFAQQFTPQQLIDVMTKSPENRDVRVHDDPTCPPGFHRLAGCEINFNPHAPDPTCPPGFHRIAGCEINLNG